MQMNITKAVFAVAGSGTRFLSATKASPKEMLSIVDKPLIRNAVEDLPFAHPLRALASDARKMLNNDAVTMAG